MKTENMKEIKLSSQEFLDKLGLEGRLDFLFLSLNQNEVLIRTKERKEK